MRIIKNNLAVIIHSSKCILTHIIPALLCRRKMKFQSNISISRTTFLSINSCENGFFFGHFSFLHAILFFLFDQESHSQTNFNVKHKIRLSHSKVSQQFTLFKTISVKFSYSNEFSIAKMSPE